MRYWIAKFFFFVSGWRFNTNGIPLTALKKTVMIAAPHTSNWDLPYALGGFWLMRLRVKYFIKSMYTKSPVGFLFKMTGAVGVERGNDKKNNLVAASIDYLNTQSAAVVLVPAEGTRKRVERWRTGFYHIALGAKVPISLGYLDYKNKEAGILDVFHPTGNFEADMLHIQEKYRGIQGKYPELYNEQIF
ncbi:MAG: 1-acyl-sn-glycerol-3-phosphate acyltransferase [Schleiferiaceae bacterium]|nr:1-acyl-sn-glycerol-3-phosphate acyltransferase [Schleiferiaceae bacterium]